MHMYFNPPSHVLQAMQLKSTLLRSIQRSTPANRGYGYDLHDIGPTLEGVYKGTHAGAIAACVI